LKSGKYDRDFVESRCVGFESLQKSLEAFSIPRLLLAAGIDERVAEDLANLVINSSRMHVIVGNELFHDPASGDLIRLALDLVLIKGDPSGLTLFSEGGNWFGAFLAGAMAGLPSRFNPPTDLQLSFENFPLLESMKALILTETIWPMVDIRSEFNILIDTHESLALNIADVVLPARAFTEIEGSFVPAMGGIRYLKTMSKCPGSAFPDHSILQVLGRAMNFAGFDWKDTGTIQAEIEETASKSLAPEKEKLSLLPIVCPDRLIIPIAMKQEPRRFRSVELESIVHDLRRIRQSRILSPESVANPIIPEEER